MTLLFLTVTASCGVDFTEFPLQLTLIGTWAIGPATLALSCLIVFIIALNKTTQMVSGATSENETL